MYRRSAAILWLALGFGSGVVASMGTGPTAWLPSSGLLAVAITGGTHVAVGVAASVVAGWVGARTERMADDRLGSASSERGTPVAAPARPPALARLRSGLDRRIEQSVGPIAAPLALALVSGRRESVSRSVRSEFSRSGTAHLLAISGFHVGVVAGLFALAAAALGCGPRSRTGVATLLVWLYVLMIGSPASAVRAAGLLSVLCVGRLMGRPTRRLPGLAAVFLASLVVRPSLLGGIGFQLSFAASFGLLITASWPDRAWRSVSTTRLGSRIASLPSAHRATEAMVRGATVAVGATLPTIPLIAWHFGTVSLVSVPATLVAMPLAAASIVAILLAVVASAVLPGLGAALGSGAAVVVALFEGVIRAWATIPWAAIPMSGHSGVVIGVSLVVFAGLVRTAPNRRAALLAAALSATSAIPIVDGWGLTAGRGSLEFFFIDVGQGDATLIRSPANRWILVDAGPSSRGWDAGAQRVVPLLARLGVRRLETLVLTHADADHVGGAAAVIRSVQVGAIADPGNAKGSQPFLAALEESSRKGIPWLVLEAGQQWELDGVTFQVLWPADDGIQRSANDDSVVLLVRYGRFEALLTGDASTEIERGLIDQLPDSVEVLKVGHHGSRTSTDTELLMGTAPQTAIISVGARNRYGHPAPSVVSRLQLHGAWILRTDRDGTVRIRAGKDGEFHASTGRR